MTVDPLAIAALVGLVASVVRIVRVHADRGRVAVGIVGWIALAVATGSPLAASAREQLSGHMVAHIVVMFLAPIAVVWSGAGRHWWWSVPVALRRRLLSWWYRGRTWRWPRSAGHPLLAGITLNTVMVVSHLPAVFNVAMSHDALMTWVVEPAFWMSGVWYFRQLVPSGRRALRVGLGWQLAVVVGTMLEMLVLAMAMAIFTSSAWYAMPMGGTSMPMPTSFHDQQLAAAILWICGDFWAVPCLVVIVRRLVARDGSLLNALDRQASRWSVSD